MVPAFFHPPERIRRVLVLGVGGGTVIRLLHRYIGPQQIIGIDIDPLHLMLARRFFGVRRDMADLFQEDAVSWLRRYKGPPFDMIIDDLFGEHDGEGVRAVALDGAWLGLLNKHLNSEGVLVVNLFSIHALKASAYFKQPELGACFQAPFVLSMPGFDNRVAVFLRKPSTVAGLRRRLASTDGLNACGGRNRLCFRVVQYR